MKHKGVGALFLIISTMQQLYCMNIPTLNTLLHEAVKNNNLAKATKLLDQGAEPNCTNKHEQTPLHIIASMTESTTNVENLKHLCASSKKFNTATNIQIATLFIKRGANIHAQDFYKNTPLHCAAAHDNLPITQLLIEHGASIDTLDQLCKTPVHEAALNCNAPLAICLLKTIIKKPYRPDAFAKAKILFLGVLKPDANNPSILNKLPLELLHTIFFYAPEYLFNARITHKAALTRVASTQDHISHLANAYKELAYRLYASMSAQEKLPLCKQLQTILTTEDFYVYNPYKYADYAKKNVRKLGARKGQNHDECLIILNPFNAHKTIERLFVEAVCSQMCKNIQ